MDIAGIILAVGGVLLLAFVWPAWRRERRHRLPEQRRWECSTIDVTPIAHRLERVRSDYVGTLHPLQTSRLFHTQLFSAARRAVSHLSFFRRLRGEPDNELHERPTA
jgi:hypothetical protein